MTRRHLTPHESIAVGVGLVALMGASDTLVDLRWPLLAANMTALIFVVRIMWHYHRTTRWADSSVGRTTMAIKAAILLMAVGGMVRRVSEVLTGAGHHVTAVAHAGDAIVAAAWLSFALALRSRDRVVRSLQTATPQEEDSHDTADSKADVASVTIPTATGADVRVDLTGVPVALAQSVAALSETLRGALTRIATLEGEVTALEDNLRRARDDRTAVVRALRDFRAWVRDGADPPPPDMPARVADLLDRA